MVDLNLLILTLVAVVVVADLISGYVGPGESLEHVCRE